MLKYETNQVPEGLSDYYDQISEGVFRLKVEGVVPETTFRDLKSKNDEFRQTNVDLLKKNAELSQFEQMFQNGDFTSEKIQAKLNELVVQRAGQMKTDFETQIQNLQEQLSSKEAFINDGILMEAVTKAALAGGVAETAMDDILARAKSNFHVVDGKLTAKDNAIGKNGRPLSVDGWLGDLSGSAPHLFKQSQGTGASRSRPSATTTTQVQGRDRIAQALQNQRK